MKLLFAYHRALTIETLRRVARWLELVVPLTPRARRVTLRGSGRPALVAAPRGSVQCPAGRGVGMDLVAVGAARRDWPPRSFSRGRGTRWPCSSTTI